MIKKTREPFFLKKTIDDLLSEDKSDFSEVFLILPTRRSVLYARKYIIEICAKAIVFPQILTLDDFVNKYSERELIGREEQLLYLLKAFQELGRNSSTMLEDILNYSDLILKDFDQLDHNLVEDKKIFSSLSQIESLKRWGEQFEFLDLTTFNEEGLINDYFDFWLLLSDLKSSFDNLLKSKGLCSSGQAYKTLLENIKADLFYRDSRFIVCGFNFLSKAQIEIFKWISANFETKFEFDIDTYFVKNKYHEAGKYIRQNHFPYNPKHLLSNTNFPEIGIQSCPNKNSQIKIAIDEITYLISQKDFQKDIKNNINFISIIPSDEALLAILLESFPEHFVDSKGYKFSSSDLINISIGRSLSESGFYKLLLYISELQKDYSKLNYIPFNKLEKILKHTFVLRAFEDQTLVEKFDKNSRYNNKNRYQIEELEDLSRSNKILSEIIKFSLIKKSDFVGLCNSLVKEFIQLKGLGEEELIFLKRYSDTFEALNELLKNFESNLNTDQFHSILFKLLRSYKVPFSGQPLAPIQIIGLLETRALDFENVYILSCNEGELPSKRSFDSLIPFDISMEFGLPTIIDRDASLSYTFYRLFNRSSRIELFYHSSNDSLNGKSSPSRFIQQLELEILPEFNIKANKRHISHYFPGLVNDHPQIEKNDFIIEKLKLYLSGRDEDGEIKYGLSPSMINTYFRNPLEFFKRAILKVKEQDELEDQFAASTFGTILHETLEMLFKDYQNEVIDSDIISKIHNKTEIKSLLHSIVKKNARDIYLDSGINLLYLHTAQVLIEKYLILLKNSDPFEILALEKKLKTNILLKNRIDLTITGMADRIDKTENKIRIVDYKSGSLSLYGDYFKFSSLEKLESDPNRDKIIQLLLYKYLLHKSEDGAFNIANTEIEAGFYFFRKNKTAFIPLIIDDAFCEEESFIALVEEMLGKICSHMLDPHINLNTDLRDDILV